MTHADSARIVRVRTEVGALTKEFDYPAFLALHGDAALPLFLIREGGEVVPFTAEEPPSPQPGQVLVSLVSKPAAPEVAPSGEKDGGTKC